MAEQLFIAPGDVTPPTVGDRAFTPDKVARHGIGAPNLPPDLDDDNVHDGTAVQGKIRGENATEHANADGSVVGDHLQDEIFTSRHFAEGAALGRNFAPGELGERQTGIQQVDYYHIKDDSVTGDKIDVRQILPAHIYRLNYSQVNFEGHQIVPGGSAGDVLTHTGSGMAWAPPAASRWEQVAQRALINSTVGRLTAHFAPGRNIYSYSLFCFILAPTDDPDLVPLYVPAPVLQPLAQRRQVYEAPKYIDIYPRTSSIQIGISDAIGTPIFSARGWDAVYGLLLPQ